MSRRLPHTPSSHIRNALRTLTLRCRERQAARKATGYRCASCGAKHSRAAGAHVTVEAHHTRPPNWERVISVVREELLQTPDAWRPLCEQCHDAEHGRIGTERPLGGQTGENAYPDKGEGSK